MKRETLGGVSVVVLVILSCVAASMWRTYRVQWTVFAQLLSNDHEVYLFVGERPIGWRLSYLRLAGESMLAVLGTGSFDPDVRPSDPIIVFRITREKIERYSIANADQLDMVTPSFRVDEDHIYVGSKWQWTGRTLVRTTEADEHRLARSLSAGPFGDYSNRDGWSNREFASLGAPPGGTQIPFDLEGQRLVLDLSGGAHMPVEVDVRRGEHPMERLYALDQRMHAVTKAEYDAIFHLK